LANQQKPKVTILPLASIIIPTYNQAAYIQATIDSALSQTYRDVEVIVVDDGSTDETSERLKDYRNKIHCLRQNNKGPSAARNLGFRASKGDYILFLDSDDLLSPDMIATHVETQLANPIIGLTYSRWKQIDPSGTKILGEISPIKPEGDLIQALLRRKLFFYGSATVMRRECLEKVGLFDESLSWGEDVDMWLRIAQAGFSFGFVDRTLTSYRVHHQSLTAGVSPQQVQEWGAGLEKFFSDPTLPPSTRAIEPEVRSILHYETASRFFRDGAIEVAQEQLRQAIQAYPQMNAEWLLDWVSGSALDPRTNNPIQFLETIFNNLVPEATNLRGLRRRAFGRYHVAATFAAHDKGNKTEVRQHFLPAIKNEPSAIFNRGFIRIVLESLVR
jgi:GT2 family glycosyltransferase